MSVQVFFFFNDTAPTEIYPFPLHDALPISVARGAGDEIERPRRVEQGDERRRLGERPAGREGAIEKQPAVDRKSTRLNSSHSQISYAVFCLKKKKKRRASVRACDMRDSSFRLR